MQKVPHRCIGAFWLAAISMFGACAQEPLVPTQPVEIQAVVTLAGAPVACNQNYQGWGKTYSLADARLYLSEVELFRLDSQSWEPMRLHEDPWQHQGVALLDFENAQGKCASFGSPTENRSLRGLVPEGAYSGLRFSVGMRPELNHLDPNVATGPFAETGMFWTWQSGYKFLKLDILSDRGPSESPIRYNLHLGSTGCSSPAALMAPDAPCARPNLARITLNGFDPSTQRINIALDSLIGPLLSAPLTLETSCMGSPGQPEHCDAVMRNLGLEPQTGQCLQDCAAQRVFSALPMPVIPGSAEGQGNR